MTKKLMAPRKFPSMRENFFHSTTKNTHIYEKKKKFSTTIYKKKRRNNWGRKIYSIYIKSIIYKKTLYIYKTHQTIYIIKHTRYTHTKGNGKQWITFFSKTQPGMLFLR